MSFLPKRQASKDASSAMLNNMTIAVTGASGFIGREVLAELENNNKVIALTRDAAGCDSSGCCEWRETDYSYESLAEAIEGADVLIHLAGVRGTEDDQAKFVINRDITENLLRAMKAAGTGRIVFASTVSVYDDVKLMPWTEDAPLKGRTAYGESKIACEKLIEEYAENGEISYGIARIAQVLGEGERRRGMMNVFMDTARSKGTLKVMGESIARRQYVYIKDLAKVLCILACGNDKLSIDDSIVVNVGMPNAYTNLEIAKIVNEVFGNTEPIDYDNSYPETAKPFCMNTSRMKSMLGYEAKDMRDAIIDIKSSSLKAEGEM